MQFNPITDFFVIGNGLLSLDDKREPIEIGVRVRAGWDAIEGSRTGPVYELVPGAEVAPMDRIEAFWCGYTKNMTRFTVLTNRCRYMFTPTMDGCSFGIGHHSKNSVIVAHANRASAQTGLGDYQSMEAAQKSDLKNFFRSTHQKMKRTLSPSAYRIDERSTDLRGEIASSTFGVCTNDRWKFYKKRYMPGMGDFTVYGTQQI